MKLRMSIHRKEGRPDYGSDGVGLELELDVPDGAFSDYDMLSAHVQQGYDACQKLVAERLEDLRQDGRPATPPPPRRPEPDRQDERYPTAHRNDGKPYRGRPETPEDGRQLMGLCRRKGLDRELQDIGRRLRLPNRILDWTPEEVQDAYQALTADSHRSNGAAY
jgi:hypothetical protein